MWHHPWRWLRLLGVVPCLVLFALGRADHGALKACFLRAALGGVARKTLDDHTKVWIRQFVRRGCFDDALAAIKAHQNQSDVLILMSASVDTYVPALAQALGFTECICTPITWRANGRYDGALAGPNCRDQEKVRQFRQRSAAQPDLKTWAYGNSAPDLPHLRLADRGILINGSRALQAQASDLECIEWR